MVVQVGFTHSFILLFSGMTQAFAGLWTGPDIMATQKEYSKHKSAISSSGIIYIGKRGTYMSMVDSMGTMIIASNNRKKMCWMANKKMKIYTQARMNIRTGDCNAMTGGMQAGQAVVDYGSLMSNKPCEGYEHKRKLATDKTAGRPVQQWSCTSSRGHQSMQWYDTEYKIVTKSIEYDSILELVEIQKKTMPRGLLQIPRGYKKVSSEEFERVVIADAMSNNFKQQQLHNKTNSSDEKDFISRLRESAPDR